MKKKIEKRYNTFNYDEYIFYLNKYKEYKNFNIYGIFNSFLENKILTDPEKLKLIKKYSEKFYKSFEFLKVKNEHLYLKLFSIIENKDYTANGKNGLYDNAVKNIERDVEKILNNKKIKYRNFGENSKAMDNRTGYKFMTREKENKEYKKNIKKSLHIKKERKQLKNIINDHLLEDDEINNYLQ